MFNLRTMKIAANMRLLIFGMMLILVKLSEQSLIEENALQIASTNESNYIELGLVLDNALYQQLGQDDDQVKQYSLSLVKQANALLRTINVSVHLVEVIVWKVLNEIPVTNDTIATLINFQTFVRNIDTTNANLDTVILLSGFRELQMSSASYLRSICKQPPSAAVIRIDTVQSAQNAAAVVHEIGHLLGAGHDHECRGYVMSPFADDWNDEGWSRGSLQELVKWKELGLWKCLANKPSKSD